MIDKKLLKPGDILLCRVGPKAIWSSKFIAWAQKLIGRGSNGQNYCHVAMIDVDTDFILEAKWPKTRKWRIDWVHMDERYVVELWRVKGATPAKVKKALTWIHKHLGEWYDLPIFLFGWINFKHAEVCSTLVSKAWKAAGVKFVNTVSYGKQEDLITPDEIAANTKLIRRIK